MPCERGDLMTSTAQSASALLATLQQADSFFPAGGIAFSWGVETLIADGGLHESRQMTDFMRGQIEHRWACFDRCVVAAAFAANGNLITLGAIDEQVEAMTLPAESRQSSKRAGGSLLAVHERIGTAVATEYRAAVKSGAALGHLSVVQGAMWLGAGLTSEQAQAASAHTACVSLLGAALRLGLIGHLHAQETLTALRMVIAEILARPAASLDELYSYTPATEIAVMRHEVQPSRLFAN